MIYVVGAPKGRRARCRFGMLAPGDRIDGRYRVTRQLGEGGMGAVYAVQDDHGQSFALKVLLDATDATLAKRFAREAQTTAKLSSQHVPRIWGTGILPDGSPYILMELLHGEDLAEMLARQGTLTAREMVVHVLQACDALAEAHRLGMVHRDIKPANLFVATLPSGERCVKLLDFGISKLALNPVAPMTQLTQTGSFLGSPEYMAPEQLLSSTDVDCRADLWALGVTMHELLAGTLPFQGDTVAELISSIMRDPPRSLRRRRPDLPDGLLAIIARCLDKDPELRFGDVAELAAALRSALPALPAVTLRPSFPSASPVSGSSPTLASPSAAPLQPGVTSIKPEHPRRRAWPVALAGVILLALGTAATVFWARHVGHTTAASSAEVAPRASVPKRLRKKMATRVARAEEALEKADVEAAEAGAMATIEMLEAADFEIGGPRVSEAAHAMDLRARVALARLESVVARLGDASRIPSGLVLHLYATVDHGFAALRWDPSSPRCSVVHTLRAHRIGAEAVRDAAEGWAADHRRSALDAAASWAAFGVVFARLARGHREVPTACNERISAMGAELADLERDIRARRSKLR